MYYELVNRSLLDELNILQERMNSLKYEMEYAYRRLYEKTVEMPPEYTNRAIQEIQDGSRNLGNFIDEFGEEVKGQLKCLSFNVNDVVAEYSYQLQDECDQIDDEITQARTKYMKKFEFTKEERIALDLLHDGNKQALRKYIDHFDNKTGVIKIIDSYLDKEDE